MLIRVTSQSLLNFLLATILIAGQVWGMGTALVSSCSHATLPERLSQAAKHGNIAPFAVYLQQGGNLNAKAQKSGSAPLHLAIIEKHYHLIEWLLDNGADIEEQAATSDDSIPLSPLLLAVLRNDHRVVQLLLEKGANPNAQDEKSGNTPLHFAIIEKTNAENMRIMELLLQHGADPLMKNHNEANPLGVAILNAHIKPYNAMQLPSLADRANKVKLLINWGADVTQFCANLDEYFEKMRDKVRIKRREENCTTAEDFEHDLIKYYPEESRAGGDFHKWGREYPATYRKKAFEEIFKHLQTAPDCHPQTDMHKIMKEYVGFYKGFYGTRDESQTIQSFILLNNPIPSIVFGNPLEGTLATGKVISRFRKLLLRDKASINQSDALGFTPLLLAVYVGNYPLVLTLCEKGALLDARTKSGLSALNIARHQYEKTQCHVYALMEMSLSHKAEKAEQARLETSKAKEAIDKAKVFAQAHLLRKAIENNDTQAVERNISEHTVNVSFENGYTPLIVAAQQGKTDFVNLLLAAGAKPTHEDNNYNTALRWATLNGHVETVQALAQAMKPEDVRIKTRGKSCFEVAQEEYEKTKNERFKQIIDVLKQF